MHKPHFHPQFFDVLQISNFDIENTEIVIFCIALKMSEKELILSNSIYSFKYIRLIYFNLSWYTEEYSIPKLLQ